MSAPSDLTPSQWEAVSHIDGPMMVLAGPGSGKTRVITRRIAHLIESGVQPQEILAITFTNKAAREMQERVESLIPGSRIWVSTFHSFCAQMLRRWASYVGLESNYSILDVSDQQQILKRVISDLGFDAVQVSPSAIGNRIGRAKNDLLTPDAYASKFEASIGDHLTAMVAKIYPEYQQELRKSNSVDFDDLLLYVVVLLTESEELRSELDQRFRYVLVDEYQDTNLSQFKIATAISQRHRNICVTGDPDQSIYSWRGARVDNIMDFERDYPDCKVVRLEQNFRSTQSICQAADQLISNNRYRKPKALVTDNDEGIPVEHIFSRDGHAEAETIVQSIQSAVLNEGRSWNDFAVFYRVNSLSRQLEQAFQRNAVPFQIAAGYAFFERAEIKDVVAYLRLVHNPQDNSAFLRVVNKPLRGIGKTTQTRLQTWADRNGVPLLEAASRANEIPKLSKRAVAGLKKFAAMIEEFTSIAADKVETLLLTILDTTALTAAWIASDAEQDAQRVANVNELITAARQFDQDYGENNTLQAFLESVSLASDTDKVDDSAGVVTLMTMHAAKGLEFPIVYIVGVEQNLIPHERSLREGDVREYEEERRLLFVGVTRAMERLYLTSTQRRETRGRHLHSIPSDFMRELSVEQQDITYEPSEYANYDDDYGVDTEPAYIETGNDDDSFDVDNPTVDDRHAALAKLPLTTGAALLSGQQQEAELPIGFNVGMKVRHPRNGIGTVMNVGGYSRHRTVTVRFETSELEETYVVSKCPLQPIGMR